MDWTRRLLLFVLLFVSALPAQIDRAKDDFNLAAGLHDRGLHERAIKAFEDFLTKWPQHARAQKAKFYLGQSLVELGRDKEALPWFRGYLTSGERDLRSQARLRAGELLFRLGQSKESVSEFESLLAERPDDEVFEAALYFLGEAAAAANDTPKSKLAYEQLAARFPKGRYASFAHQALGFLAFKARDFEAARAMFSEAARSTDADLALESRIMGGECLLELNQNDEARRTFEDAAKRAQGAFLTQAELGVARALLAQKQHQPACDRFATIAREHPADERVAPALVRAAATLHERKESKLALSLLGKIQNKDTKVARDVQYWTSLLMAETGSRDEAIEALKASLANEKGPKALRRRYTLGDQLTKAGRLEEAVAVFGKVRADAGEDPLGSEAGYAEAFALNRLQKYDQAVSVLETLKQKDLPPDLRRDHLFALAENLFALKRYDRAASFYQAVGKESPERRQECLYKLGWCAYLLENHQGAISTFEEVIAHEGPFKDEARYLIGKCYEALGRSDEARVVFSGLGQGASNADLKVRAQLGAAAAARKQKKTPEAISSLQEAVRLARSDDLKGQALASLGDLHLDEGNADEAHGIYARFLREVPEHVLAEEVRLRNAWALHLIKRPSEALALVGQVANTSRDTACIGEALYLAGVVESAQGHHQEATVPLRALLTKCPGHARTTEARLLLGISWARAGKPEGAIPHLEALVAAAQTTSGRDTALYELAFCQESIKGAEPRDALFERLVNEHPESRLALDALFRLGESAYEAKYWAKAIARYRALTQKGDVGELADKAWYKLAWCARHMAEHARAAEAFEKVASIPKSPLSGESWFLAGEDHLKIGAHEDALRCFAVVVEKYAGHELQAPAQLERILCLARLERFDEVIEQAPAVIRGHPDRPRTLLIQSALGDAFFARKSYSRARAAFGAVTRASEGPLAARAQFRIGESHQAEGTVDAAIDELLKVTILYAHPEWGAKATLLAADLLLSKGLPEKARRLYEELGRNYPASPESKLVGGRLEKLGARKESQR